MDNSTAGATVGMSLSADGVIALGDVEVGELKVDSLQVTDIKTTQQLAIERLTDEVAALRAEVANLANSHAANLGSLAGRLTAVDMTVAAVSSSMAFVQAQISQSKPASAN